MDKPYKVAGEKWEVPKADNNYHRNLMDKGWRTTLKPLNIDQPEGPSFTVCPSLLDLVLKIFAFTPVVPHPPKLRRLRCPQPPLCLHMMQGVAAVPAPQVAKQWRDFWEVLCCTNWEI